MFESWSGKRTSQRRGHFAFFFCGFKLSREKKAMTFFLMFVTVFYVKAGRTNCDVTARVCLNQQLLNQSTG